MLTTTEVTGKEESLTSGTASSGTLRSCLPLRTAIMSIADLRLSAIDEADGESI